MMKTLNITLLSAIAALGLMNAVHAAGGGAELHCDPYPHEGVIGAHYDRAAAQRGFQVYKEVCAACHSLKYVAFRSLAGIGFSEAEVKAIAADFTVQAISEETGEAEDRPGKPFDYFPSPYPNAQAAAFANNNAVPPDLSLMTAARADGVCYVQSLLTGFREPTEEELKHLPNNQVPAGSHFNPVMDGGIIAMAPPLIEGLVEYGEGNPPATVEQMAHDVATFLAWTADPKLEERKRLGFFFLAMVAIVSGLLFFSYRRISKRVLGH